MTRPLRTSLPILALASSATAFASVTIVITGESVGYLEPCGCTTGQLGGIARRHTYLRNVQVRHKHLLLVDLGDLSAGFGRQEQLKAETLVNAMNEMGYAAAAVGERDVFLGLAHLTRLQREVAEFPMLCANLVRNKADGNSERPFAAGRIVSAGVDGPRILLVGLLSKEADGLVQAIEPSLRVTDPSRALRDVVGRAERGSSLAAASRSWPDRCGQELRNAEPRRCVGQQSPRSDSDRSPPQSPRGRGEGEPRGPHDKDPPPVRGGTEGGHGLRPIGHARAEAARRTAPDQAEQTQQNGKPPVPTAPNLIVVLAHMPQHEAVALAEAVPSVDFVLCGGDHVKPGPPKQVGKTWVVTCGAQGKYMVEVSIPSSRGVGAPRPDIATVALDGRYPDSSDMLAILDGYQAHLKREQLLAKRARNVFDKGMEYVGSRACVECHKEHFARWQGHRHAAAYQTLRRRKRHHDPECVGCHVVGLEYASGFRDAQRTPDLAGVGCESCHGPGNLHCEQTKRQASSPPPPRPLRLRGDTSSLPRTPYGKTDETTCTNCHDSAHDPKRRYKLFESKPHCGFEGAVELLRR